jgi:LPS-assembly protein
MSTTLREKLGLLTLLAAASSPQAAENLPLFRVDPALLVPPPKPETRTTGATPVPAAAPPAATPPVAQTFPIQDGRPTVIDKPAVAPAARAPAPVVPVAPAAQRPAPLPDPEASAVPADPGKPQPVFLTADSITGTTDVEMRAEGNADLRQGTTSINSDLIVHREENDEAEATGNVILRRDQDEMRGPHMKLRLQTTEGFFDTPTYAISRAPTDARKRPNAKAVAGTGVAERLDFQGEGKYRLSKATYSTCTAGPKPDWFARVADLSLDYNTDRAVAHDATIVFKDTPILYAPWMSFSLNNDRKSGLLAPSIGSSTEGGPEFTIPFYWNIAPNMDATLGLREMGRRGSQWQGEYRYLNQNYKGQVSAEYMDRDRLFGKERSLFSLNHAQEFGEGFSGNLNLNRVSDDTYFTDLSSRVTNVSQTNLLRQGNLSYAGGWWNANVMAQRYQTLQDPGKPPVSVPYDRLPQVTAYGIRPDMPFGTTLTLQGEYVDFSHPTQVIGKRTTFYPQLSLPFQTAAFYITPKIGVSSTRYQLERQAIGVSDSLTRTVPIYSLDSGLTFERDTTLLQRNLLQTLEPRLYYLRVPYRDQRVIPVFDTGLADFNFGQMFSDNVFTGGDRIADANQATVAVTSRLIDPDTGAELLKGAVGQRYYFTDQRVALPGITPRTGHTSDFLAALTGRIGPELSADAGLQYNSKRKQLERYSLSARYQPEIGKVINAGFRYTRALLNQVDVSGQWPLGNGWYGVGRYNYSFSDKRLVESLAGLEYNGNCWVARAVVHRLATAVGRANNAFFIQLELNGFSQIGTNPLEVLKRNIPGFGRLNRAEPDPEFSYE